MMFGKLGRVVRLFALFGVAFIPACGKKSHPGFLSSNPYAGDVLTWHNDFSRSGQYLVEMALTWTSVNASTFAKLFTFPVDGQVYAQPLYKSGVAIPAAGTKNLVFVATQHDSVYAVDADLGVQVWTVSFLSTNVTTVPYTDVGSSDITPEIGITSTPVIDPAAQILYVLAKTKEGPGPAYTYVQRLHALDLATGAEMLGGPVVIQASVPGTGDGSVGGVVSFDPLRNGQRSALLLLGGTLYIAWASHGDTPIYHGWVMGYDAHTLSQVSVWCASPNNPTAGSTPGQAAIWMDGGGLATDGTFLYFSTGNGYFDANSLSAPNTEYGDSFVKLSTAGGSLVVADYFTPFNQASLSSGDLDLGSGGVVLLPDQGGAHPHLMLGGGKQALIYLIDRDNLGQFNASTDQVVQTVDLAALGITYTPISPSTGTAPGIFSTPAYFNGTIYYKPAAPDVSVNCASPLLAFPVSGGLLSTSPIQSSPTWGWPGSTPSISANGVANGIVWALDVGPALTNAVLHAFKASDLTELYNSTQNAGDALGKGVKFTVPTVANGKVYVGTAATLAIYGLK